MIGNTPCAQINDDTLKVDVVRQCTHLTIKGHEVTGRLVLERTDAFIFQTNGAFIFISKTGEQCLYSGYLTKTDMDDKQLEDLNFENTQVRSMCIENFRTKIKN
ncbi:hypothetical protein A6K25_09730 [Alteromonas stellipolaris]|nr:hypothetical protein A6K25_09730 [Alteromonas stellipolaris]